MNVGEERETPKKPLINIEKYGEKLEYIFSQTKTCIIITNLCKCSELRFHS